MNLKTKKLTKLLRELWVEASQITKNGLVHPPEMGKMRALNPQLPKNRLHRSLEVLRGEGFKRIAGLKTHKKLAINPFFINEELGGISYLVVIKLRISIKPIH